jgi:membrane-associated protease RseP (regulator of RpoE activity)
MRQYMFTILIIALCTLSSACVHTSLYQNWSDRLRELPSQNGKVQDVSMLLGSPPSHCELVENPSPTIGINLDPQQEQPIITHVRINGPAYQSGIRRGDIIKKVNGQPVGTYQQVSSAIREITPKEQAFEIETNRGITSVVPRIPQSEQCYWDVQAGRVARTGSFAAVNRYGGSSSSGGAAYEKFFRTSCRVDDDFLTGCKSNWQQ